MTTNLDRRLDSGFDRAPAWLRLGLTPKARLNKLGLNAALANCLFDRSPHFIARLN